MDEVVTFLKKVSLFHGLKDDQIKIVLDKMDNVEYDKNEIVFSEGEEGDKIFIIYEGEVEISQQLTLKLGSSNFDKRDKILIRLSSNNYAFFGEMALIEKDVRSATVICKTPCKFFVISKEVFEELATKYPEMGYKIILNIARVISSRLRQANQDILKLTTALSIALERRV